MPGVGVPCTFLWLREQSRLASFLCLLAAGGLATIPPSWCLAPGKLVPISAPTLSCYPVSHTEP